MTFRRRAFAGIEIALFDCTGHAFSKHSHDEFVIGANFVGREHIWLDRRNHEAGRDQVTLYNPGQVQAADGHNAPWRFVSFYLDPRAVAQLAGLTPDTVFKYPILWDSALADLVRTYGMRYLDPGIDEGEVLEGVVDLLAKLFGVLGSQRPAQSSLLKPEVRRVADWLLEEMSAPPQLEDLAESEGLTPVQLVRAFTRVHGLPPFAWLNAERLKVARHAISRGAQLSRLASELGFADQAHFTRRFKAVYGVPPATWARGRR